MKRVAIHKEFSNDYITRVAGERLREMILQAHRAKETIELDFTGVVIGSASFFDEGIAKLVEEDGGDWTRTRFKERVAFKGLYAKDREVLEQAMKLRNWK